MEIKELIDSVKNDYKLVELKEEELLRLENLCGVSGISYDEKASTSPNPNRQEQVYLNYIEFKEELEKFKASTIKNRITLRKLIDGLNTALSREVMYEYCLNNISISRLAKKYHYTRQAVYKIYNDAVEEMQKEFTKVDKS